MAANSPYESAAATVSNPLMTQAASSPPVDPVWRAISAETMKIPEPIIDPTTIMVESNKPRPRTNPDDSVLVTTPSITSVDVGSDIAPLLFNSRERQSPDWRLLNPPIGRLAFPGFDHAFRAFTKPATSRYCRPPPPGFPAPIRSRPTPITSPP